MDHTSRMMHYQQAYGMGGPMDHQQQQGGGEDGQDGLRSHADINTILDQIMNITDQSLDEAQVSFLSRYSMFIKHSWLFNPQSVFVLCAFVSILTARSPILSFDA